MQGLSKSQSILLYYLFNKKIRQHFDFENMMQILCNDDKHLAIYKMKNTDINHSFKFKAVS